MKIPTKPAFTRRALLPLALALPLAAGLLPADARADVEPAAQRRVAPQGFSEQRFCERELKGQLFMRTELFFGLNRPGGTVSAEEFQRFVDDQVTPSFPDGLTLLEGRGQFRGSSGVVEREGARVLVLLYPYRRESSRAVDAIRVAYRAAFEQESVLRVDEASCVSF